MEKILCYFLHFAPVITIVVYYGEKAWDGAVTLHEMLNIPKEMKEFVNDYKMRLVEARQNNLRLHNINNVDLFNLIAILLDNSKTRKEIIETAIKYGEEHKTEKSVIMTIALENHERNPTGFLFMLFKIIHFQLRVK